MPNSVMRQEFYNNLRNGVMSEEDQAALARRRRQSISKHKYGGIAFRDKEEQKKKEAKGELENDK